MKTALVCGAGGFIGSNLVKRLKKDGYWVKGVDLKYPDFSKSEADEFEIFDLTNQYNFQRLVYHDNTKVCHFDEIYQLAADMGGALYVFSGEHDADIMMNSALINLNVLNQLQKMHYKGKIFYSSSACMYPQNLQNGSPRDPGGWEGYKHTHYNPSLAESDAYPANPDSEYGWEKLFSERLYLAFQRNYGMDVRIARFHNIYGPEGTYKPDANGVDKSKAPAAMCRKAINDIEFFYILGTGKQTRSFLYIDDCLEAVRLLMNSDFKAPINIGSAEMVTINQLAELAMSFISWKPFKVQHIPGPTGVMGRNSNNELIEKELGWKPKYSLKEGLKLTFDWIQKEMSK